MKSNTAQTIIRSTLATIGLLVSANSTLATPYACDITNAAGTVSFRLNENADNVKIISSGGAVTNDLGPGVKGLTVTNLGIAAGVIKVMVTRSVPAGYTLTSDDAFLNNGVYVNKFEQGRGIVVNKNPASPTFGRIYVANARGQANTGNPVRTTYQGIYMINSDDTVALDTGVTPRTAGLQFTAGNTVSPFRLSIGKDDNLLYLCDDSDPSGGLWVTDLDVSTNSIATNVFWQIGDLGFGATNHGSIYAAVVEGALAGGNLKVFTMDEDLVPTKTPWRYDANSGPFPSTAAQVSLGQAAMINGTIDLVKGGSSNYLYASQNNRVIGPTNASIRVFAADGTTITNSLDASRQYLGNPSAVDLLQNTTALDISADGTTLALLRGTTFGSVLLVPLTNGVFNFAATNSFSLGTGAGNDNNRDIAFDAAGNLYSLNTQNEWMRVFSKGGASVATTGTDGTFALTVPPTLVSVTASTPNANEQGPVNGVFKIIRTGDTSVPLTVNYTVTGTATPGSDYTALPGSVSFLAGAISTNITVQVINDTEVELTETVILNISGSANYGVTTGSATVSILDNEATEVSLTPAQTDNRLLEGYSASKVAFQLTRRGLISPALSVNLSYSGTATVGADYSAPATVSIGSGIATALITLTPIDDELYEGNETVNISVAAGSGYNISATNTASAVIIDDDYPNGVVLFSDNFETDSSVNWTTNSNDGFVDSAADFAFDYSQLFVPPVPGGTSTKGLRFRLNEQFGPVNAVSASPAILNLPTDYRLKFKGWVNYNGPMLDGGSGSTMHLTAGVGTTPDHANAGFYSASDGIWFDCDGDGGSTFLVGDTSAYVASTLQGDLSGVYAAGTNDNPRSTGNPYYSLWGSIPAPPAQLANFPTQTGISQPGNMGEAWHTFVITKATNAVSWVIDGIPVATVPADSTPLSTNVFVGFEDLFAGVLSGNPPMSFVLIENLRVETFVSAPIIITNIRIVGANVEVTFSGPATAVPGDFKLQSASVVNGTYADDNSASITALGSGLFKAMTALNGPARFYRIR